MLKAGSKLTKATGDRLGAVRVALVAGLVSGAAAGLLTMLSGQGGIESPPAASGPKLVERVPGVVAEPLGQPAPETLASAVPRETPRLARVTAARNPDEPSRRPAAVAALPPPRPAAIVTADTRPQAPATIVVQAPSIASAPRQPIVLLGFALPGSEHLPTGRDTLQAVSSVGERVASLGQAVADTVRIR